MKLRKLFVIFILLSLIHVIAWSEQMKKEVKRELSIYEVHISANREYMFYLYEYAVQAMANKDLTA